MCQKKFDVIKSKKLFVLDMDGTIYLGEKLLSGSLEFIEALKKKNRDFLFFTNNSSKSSEFYKSKLSKMGLNIENSQIATSGDVAIHYLKTNYPNAKVFMLGTKSLEESMAIAGIKIVEEDPDVVLVGFDTSLTYEKISKACGYIRSGCEFVATHLDLNCPTEDGFIPDCGAMCAMITASTNRKPKYLGKPCKETLEFILNKTNYEKEDVIFIGDRLYTDIAIGFENRVSTALVLTGETKKQDLEVSQIKPEFIFDSVFEMVSYL